MNQRFDLRTLHQGFIITAVSTTPHPKHVIRVADVHCQWGSSMPPFHADYAYRTISNSRGFKFEVQLLKTGWVGEMR